MPIAYFDLDRTLLSINSATLWIRRELRERRMPWSSALRGAAWIGAYQLGFSALEDAIERSIEKLRGTSEAELRERTERFWEEELVCRVRPGARRALDAERESGAGLWLLTSSSAYLGDAAARDLGLDGAVATHFEAEAGVLTGRASLPLCFGPGKVVRAQEVAEAHGATLDDASFYSDSFSDLPMLEAVARPVAVHPDPRLRRLALRRGWPVADWSR